MIGIEYLPGLYLLQIAQITERTFSFFSTIVCREITELNRLQKIAGVGVCGRLTSNVEKVHMNDQSVEDVDRTNRKIYTRTRLERERELVV